MKYIYLDTAHLLKWQNGNLEKEVENKLSMLVASEEYLFVISDLHIVEMTHRTDRAKVKDVLIFLNNLPSVPCVQLAIDIFSLEIIQAGKKFNGESDLSVPIFGEKNERILENDIDKFLLAYSAQNAIHEELNSLIVDKRAEILDISERLDKQQFLRHVHKQFKLRLRMAIKMSEIDINEDALIDFIMQDVNLVPSLRINFYATAYLYRDKNKEVSINDWFDILYYSSIPYVDYYSLDREACSRLLSIQVLRNSLNQTRINNNLKLLFQDILL